MLRAFRLAKNMSRPFRAPFFRQLTQGFALGWYVLPLRGEHAFENQRMSCPFGANMPSKTNKCHGLHPRQSDSCWSHFLKIRKHRLQARGDFASVLGFKCDCP